MRLLANEMIKIRRSKSVKVLFLIFLFFIFFAVSVGEGKGGPLMNSGFAGPFTWNGIMGAAGLFSYGAIAAGMVASEFELGVVRNAIGCGVSRNRYFAAKIFSVMGVSAVMYLVCNCIFSLFVTLVRGFDPEGLVYSDYWLKVLVFNGVALTVQLTCVAMYICFAYVFRIASITFAASVLVTLGETLLTAGSIKQYSIGDRGFNGPAATLWLTVQHFAADTILTEEFVLLALPCFCIMVVSLILSYILFTKRGI